MKKTIVFVLILITLVIATPAVAKTREMIGARIDVFGGIPSEFPAETPFHIWHGWLLSSDIDAIGIFDFELEIDGVPYKEDFVLRTAERGDPDLLTRIWVYNFPEGMTGTHTFTAYFLGPCQPLVDAGLYPGPCSTPNARVPALDTSWSLTVTFAAPSP